MQVAELVEQYQDTQTKAMRPGGGDGEEVTTLRFGFLRLSRLMRMLA